MCSEKQRKLIQKESGTRSESERGKQIGIIMTNGKIKMRCKNEFNVPESPQNYKKTRQRKMNKKEEEEEGKEMKKEKKKKVALPK